MTLLDLSRLLLCLGLFLKQFYLLPSGSFQIGDLVLMLSFASWLAHMGVGARMDRADYPLLAFVACETAINAIWYFVTWSTGFLVPIAMYLYVLLFVIGLRGLLDDPGLGARLAQTFRAALLLQIVFLVTGVGRWYADVRYMGTFNDPNQMAFFVFASFIAIKVLARKGLAKTWPVDDLLAIVLVASSSSVCAVLGLGVYYVLSLLFSKARTATKVIVIMLVLALCAIALPWLSARHSLLPMTGVTVLDRVFFRINGKINALGGPSGFVGGLFSDRGLNKVLQYPYYMLFGSGEAMMGRFVGTGTNELHSTPLALLFYYGVAPFLLFCAWAVSNYRRGADRLLAPEYLALLCETFFLANQRQPMFFLLIAIASLGANGRLGPGNGFGRDAASRRGSFPSGREGGARNGS